MLTYCSVVNGVEYYEIEIRPVDVQIYPNLNKTRLVGYNGEVPGPTFRMRQNTEAVVRFINKGKYLAGYYSTFVLTDLKVLWPTVSTCTAHTAEPHSMDGQMIPRSLASTRTTTTPIDRMPVHCGTTITLLITLLRTLILVKRAFISCLMAKKITCTFPLGTTTYLLLWLPRDTTAMVHYGTQKPMERPSASLVM